MPRADLEKMLIEEIKKQKRPYGMVFTDISGGFTNTSAFAPQAFKVNPVMAYRLYPDGRSELVRGIDISGTPLVALQSIRAASREIETFNGVCGARVGLGAGLGVGAVAAHRAARGREGLHPAGSAAAPGAPAIKQGTVKMKRFIALPLVFVPAFVQAEAKPADRRSVRRRRPSPTRSSTPSPRR